MDCAEQRYFLIICAGVSKRLCHSLIIEEVFFTAQHNRTVFLNRVIPRPRKAMRSQTAEKSATYIWVRLMNTTPTLHITFETKGGA